MLWQSDMWVSKKDHEVNGTVSVFCRHRIGPPLKRNALFKLTS